MATTWLITSLTAISGSSSHRTYKEYNWHPLMKSNLSSNFANPTKHSNNRKSEKCRSRNVTLDMKMRSLKCYPDSRSGLSSAQSFGDLIGCLSCQVYLGLDNWMTGPLYILPKIWSPLKGSCQSLTWAELHLRRPDVHLHGRFWLCYEVNPNVTRFLQNNLHSTFTAGSWLWDSGPCFHRLIVKSLWPNFIVFLFVFVCFYLLLFVLFG